MTPFTCIYSSECIEPAKKLFDTFLHTFNCCEELTFDDAFWYGVFCKPETYANYEHWDLINVEDDYTEALQSPCATETEKLDLIESLIYQIVRGEIEKPEWMVQIEATEVCGEYELAPSTFLYLVAKEERFEELGQRLLNFLYSVNLMTTMLDDD